MNAIDKATPIPWQCKRENDGIRAFRISGNGMILADVLFKALDYHAVSKDEAEANAALIVKAVNEYDALCGLESVAKEFVRRCECGEVRSRKTYAAFKLALALLESARKEVA